MLITCQVAEANRDKYSELHFENVIYAIENELDVSERYLQPDIPLGNTQLKIVTFNLQNIVSEHQENERRSAIINAQFEDDVSENECGKRWKVYRNTIGDVVYEPIYCHKCPDCHKRKGNDNKAKLANNALRRLKENPDLKLQYNGNVPADEVQAYQKRIQRDESAEYERSVNEDGSYSFFVQSEEEKYGDVIDYEISIDSDGATWYEYNLDEVCDFAKAVKVAQDKNKRQTGKLLQKRNRDDGEEKILVRIPAFEAVNKCDASALRDIVEDTKPLTYAEDEKSYQRCLYGYGFEIEQKARLADIPIRVSMLPRMANATKIALYNENISKFRREKGLDTSGCPNKEHIEKDGEVLYVPYLDKSIDSDTAQAIESDFEQLAASFMDGVQ